MAFNSLLNKQCTIYKTVTTINATNGERVKSRVVKHLGVPCRVQTLSGKEMFGNNKIYANATHVIFLSNAYDVDLTDVINYNGVYYNLLLQKDAGGHGHHYEYIAETVS